MLVEGMVLYISIIHKNLIIWAGNNLSTALVLVWPFFFLTDNSCEFVLLLAVWEKLHKEIKLGN